MVLVALLITEQHKRKRAPHPRPQPLSWFWKELLLKVKGRARWGSPGNPSFTQPWPVWWFSQKTRCFRGEGGREGWGRGGKQRSEAASIICCLSQQSWSALHRGKGQGSGRRGQQREDAVTKLSFGALLVTGLKKETHS